MSELIDLRRYRKGRAIVHGDVGPRQQRGSFVCTACGGTYRTRDELEHHWADRPVCRASLTRPVGNFGAKQREHCLACHALSAGETDEACGRHAYRGCPAC